MPCLQPVPAGSAAHQPNVYPLGAACWALQISRVDAEILAAVRQQSTSGSRARQDLTSAKLTIEELFGKIRDIQRKAEQSELMVQEICRDIKKLDYAKKHLTSTITALRRLAMLVNAIGAESCFWLHGSDATASAAVRACGALLAWAPAALNRPPPMRLAVCADQLQLAVERHEYAEAAHLLEAVQQLSSHFQSYAHIPKVRWQRRPAWRPGAVPQRQLAIGCSYNEPSQARRRPGLLLRARRWLRSRGG